MSFFFQHDWDRYKDAKMPPPDPALVAEVDQENAEHAEWKAAQAKAKNAKSN